MTVCIAAICQMPSGQKVIVGATDRMVTVEGLNIQFEPPTGKWFQLTPHIVALWAGDAAAQAEICGFTSYQPMGNVHAAVRAYCEQLGYYNLRQAEQVVLFPRGMTAQSFFEGERDMSPHLVQDIMSQMDQMRTGVETIICGMDGNYPQIYTVNSYGQYFCNNSIGFAAIGDGAGHAESQFMVARYHPNTPVPIGLMETFIAKRRAEVASGVGTATEMFVVSTRGAAPLNAELYNKLSDTFDQMKLAQSQAVDESYAQIDAFFDKSVTGDNPAAGPEQTTVPDPGPEPEKPPTDNS